MALRIVGSLAGYYHGRIVDDIFMTDSEPAVEGRGYYLSSGRWTKASGTNPVEAICIKSAEAGTDVKAVMELVKPGDIIEADYVGTPDTAFLPGLSAANLDANGDNVDATKVTDGHLRLLAVDTANQKVKMIALKNFCAN